MAKNRRDERGRRRAPADTTLVGSRNPGRAWSRPLLGPGERIAGRFRVVGLIGHGGMGQVFEAEDLELGTPVALKVVRPDRARADDAMRLLRHEVQLARQVTHRNVCRVFDLFQHRPETAGWGRDTRPILVVSMELLRGETLAARMATSAVPTDTALALLRQIADGLDAAHAAGVVHGDLSANNVMLVAADEAHGGERAVITDFGLARRADDGMRPRSGGTPAYLAPELDAGRCLPTPASDGYAFAVLAHQLLLGVRRDAAGPSATSRRVAAVLRRGVAERPEARFATAGGLVDTLQPTARQWRRRAAALLAGGLAALVLARSLSAPVPLEGPSDGAARAAYSRGLAALEQWQLDEARAAFDEADQRQPGQPLVAMAQAETWALRGDRSRARAILERAMTAATSSPRAIQLRVEGRFRELTGDWIRAEQVFRALTTLDPEAPSYVEGLATALTQLGRPVEAIRLLREMPRKVPRPTTDLVLARAARARGDFALQARAAARTRRAAQSAGAAHLAAEACLLEGDALDRLGRGAEARARLADARAAYEQLGDRYGLARITIELSDRTTPDDVLPMSFDAALAAIRDRDDGALEARALLRVARIRFDHPTYRDQALAQYERAKALLATRTDPQATAELRNLEALMLFFAGEQVAEAESAFVAAVDAARASGNLRLVAGIIGNHARVLMHLGQRDAAWRRHEEAITVARQCGCQDVLLLNLHTAAIVAQARKDAETAERMVDEMLTIAEATGDVRLLRLTVMAQQRRFEARGERERALANARRLQTLVGDRSMPSGIESAQSDEARLLGELGRLAEAEPIARALAARHPLARGTMAAIEFHLLLAELIARDPERLDEAEALLVAALAPVVAQAEQGPYWRAAKLGANLESLRGRPSRARQTLRTLAARRGDNARAALAARIVLGRLLRLAGERALARVELTGLLADPAIEDHRWITGVVRLELERLGPES